MIEPQATIICSHTYNPSLLHQYMGNSQPTTNCARLTVSSTLVSCCQQCHALLTAQHGHSFWKSVQTECTLQTEIELTLKDPKTVSLPKLFSYSLIYANSTHINLSFNASHFDFCVRNASVEKYHLS